VEDDRVTDVARLSLAEVAMLSWRALRRLGVPEPALPDAVQEVLLVVHRRRGDFAGQSSFRTWVFGIVLRVASGQRRSSKRASAVFSDDEVQLDTAPSGDPSPFEQLERSEAAQLLQSLLAELPPPLRDVFVLVDLEELSLQEAATSRDIPLSTCRSQLRTARRLFNALAARERAKCTWRTP
jgi:RNA polymerase sigma-70 factor (ECF subfamily)